MKIGRGRPRSHTRKTTHSVSRSRGRSADAAAAAPGPRFFCLCEWTTGYYEHSRCSKQAHWVVSGYGYLCWKHVCFLRSYSTTAVKPVRISWPKR